MVVWPMRQRRMQVLRHTRVKRLLRILKRAREIAKMGLFS